MSQDTPRAGHKLTDEQWFALRALGDVIVPPSERYDVPGGGDEAICKNVIIDADKRLARLIGSLTTLNDMAREMSGTVFSEIEEARREAIALQFRDRHKRAAVFLETLVTQCYYRDDRVMISLGMEPRAPFPEGYRVEQGDWSALDAVRRRQPFHRPVD